MNYFDIIIVIPLVWGIYKGYKKGFIIEMASFIALGLGIWGGIKFASLSANYLSKIFDISDKMMPLISFVVTFILIVIAVFSLAKILEKIIKLVALGFVNRIIGAAFGVLKFGLIISVILNIITSINSKIPFIAPKMLNSSLLYQPVSKIALIIIPGVKNINLNNMVDKALLGKAKK